MRPRILLAVLTGIAVHIIAGFTYSMLRNGLEAMSGPGEIMSTGTVMGVGAMMIVMVAIGIGRIPATRMSLPGLMGAVILGNGAGAIGLYGVIYLFERSGVNIS